MRNLKMLLMLFLAVITFGAVFSQAAEAKNAEDVFAVSEKESDWVLKSGGEADGSRRICTGTRLTRKTTRLRRGWSRAS